MADKLHNCYIWHIITLAIMKYKLKQLKGVMLYAQIKNEPSIKDKQE